VVPGALVTADGVVPVGVVVLVEVLDVVRECTVYWIRGGALTHHRKEGSFMSSHSNQKRVRSATPRRYPPNIKKLSRALIALALAEAQAETDARAEHTKKTEEQEKARAA
jgi:hypothetical protein